MVMVLVFVLVKGLKNRDILAIFIEHHPLRNYTLCKWTISISFGPSKLYSQQSFIMDENN